MGTQNTQDHVQTLTCTRALLPDVSYRLALCTHERKNALRGRAPHCSHWRPHTRWQNCGAGAGDVLSRRQHGQSHRTARPRSCARSSSTRSLGCGAPPFAKRARGTPPSTGSSRANCLGRGMASSPIYLRASLLRNLAQVSSCQCNACVFVSIFNLAHEETAPSRGFLLPLVPLGTGT